MLLICPRDNCIGVCPFGELLAGSELCDSKTLANKFGWRVLHLEQAFSSNDVGLGWYRILVCTRE